MTNVHRTAYQYAAALHDGRTSQIRFILCGCNSVQ
jgi:hypothetical protein